jgi:cold shock CspA family protein
MNERQIGQVVTYNSDKGWGFIRHLEQKIHTSDFFFYVGAVDNRISLVEGDIVTFATTPSKKKPGRQDAIDIRLHKRDEGSVASEAAPAPELNAPEKAVRP